MLYVQNQGCGEVVQCDTGKSCQKALWFIGRQWEQDGCGRRGGALDNLTTPLETPGIKEQKKQPIKESLCREDRQSLISYMGYNKAQKGQPWGAGAFCPWLSLLYRLPCKIHIPHLPGKSWEPLVKRLGFTFLSAYCYSWFGKRKQVTLLLLLHILCMCVAIDHIYLVFVTVFRNKLGISSRILCAIDFFISSSHLCCLCILLYFRYLIKSIERWSNPSAT